MKALRINNRTVQRGFSLVELLVVIAIIALLITLLFPALGLCRRLAKQSREAAAGAQLMAAFNVYSNENKGSILPGYATVAMVSGAPGSLQVTDESGNPIVDQLARRYPWRIAPYMDFNFRGLYDDPKVLEAYQSTDPSLRQYVVSVSPSYGMNADFVGGKANPGLGFNQNALRVFGPFYVTRMDQIHRTDRLLTFCSAQGVDATGGSQFASGVVPGFHIVSSPNFQAARWAAGLPTQDSTPEDFGNVAPRHAGKANVTHADGHVATLGIEDLRDMTRWSNTATRPDWMLGSN